MLHSQDIKPSNVMVDELLHAKVCDFGLSRPFTICCAQSSSPDAFDVPSTSLQHTCGVGTLRYMAPEVMQASEQQVTVQYDEACDVYSFGLLLWVLVHGQEPFAKMSGQEVALHVAPSGERPALRPRAGLEALGPLIASCWHQDKAQRPATSACAEELRRLNQSAGTSAGVEGRADEPSSLRSRMHE